MNSSVFSHSIAWYRLLKCLGMLEYQINYEICKFLNSNVQEESLGFELQAYSRKACRKSEFL